METANTKTFELIRREFLLTVAVFIVFVVLVAAFFIFMYEEQKKDLYNDLDKELLSAAQSQLLLFDDSFHRRAWQTQISREEDRRNIKRLSALAAQMHVQYLYTMVYRGGHFYFTASSMTKEDLEKGIITYTGDPYTDAPPALYRAYQSGKRVYSEYSDRWGNFRSVFVPLTREGIRIIAAADMPIDSIDTKLSLLRQTYIWSFVWILCIGLPLMVWRYLAIRNILVHQIHDNINKDKVMHRQASQAAMGEMIGMIAHQWRQPLNAISAAAIKLKMLNELETLEPKELVSTLRFIQEMSQKMSTTINDFMEFTKPDREKSFFEFKEIMTDVVKMIDAQLNTRNITLMLNIDAIPPIHGYKKELSHVLLNFISNARDAFENKSIEHKMILIHAYSHEEHIYIEIADNAGGIDPAIMDKIFDPFFTTKPAGKGSGLGLYMCKKMVEEDFGGNLSIANFNEGALFTIVFPLRRGTSDGRNG